MANDIQLKRSSVAGKVPDSGNVLVGEPVVNLADKKIYSKNGSGDIIQIAAGNLSGLADVTVSSPTENDVLTWTGSTWEAATPTSNVITGVLTQQSFTGDGTTDTFTLTLPAGSSQGVMVFVDSVLQEPSNNYSVSSTTLTFTSAPADSANIDVRYFVTGNLDTAYYLGTNYNDVYVGDGSNTTYTLSYTTSNNASLVFVNGVVQQAGLNYYVDGTSLVFSSAPDPGANILARYSVGERGVDFGNIVFDANTVPEVGQALIWDGAAYSPADVATDANVISVNGLTGVVTLDTDDISEGTNQYFTQTRARDSISVSGAGSYDNTTGVITITGGVISVAGAEGAISNVQLAAGITQTGILTTANVTEDTNLYYTDARVYSNVTQLGYITSGDLNGYATNSQLSSYALTTDITAAYNQANTATTVASAAFDSANTKVATVVGVTATTITNAHVAAAIESTALTELTVLGDVNIGGNVNLTGNVTTFTANDLVLTDPLIYIGADNTGDVVDLGLVASFTGAAYQHTGLVRDATDGKWKLFANVVAEPTTTVDFTNATYSTLKLGDVESSTGTFTSNVSAAYFIGDGSALTNVPAYDQANTATTIATSAFNAANTKVATVAGVTSTSISNTNLLDGIKTVDGSGSGLDADTLDGNQAAAFALLSGATFTGNVNASYFVGDGSALTNISVGSSVTISNTAPVSATEGDLYWDEDNGRLFIYYNDGSSEQWVEASPPVLPDEVVYSVAGATGAISNAQILSGLLTVDGSGSGLDADTLDGYNSATGNTASTVVVRDASADITTSRFLATHNGLSESFKVGDDAWIGDMNASNTIRIKGVQNAANAYIVFGTSNSTALGRAGTGALTYGGDFTASGTISAADFNSTSDINYKKDVITIDNSFNVLDQIRGVKFKWKDNDKTSYGVIAQEVQAAIPDAVEEDDTGKLSVKYNCLIGFLIEAVKEQQKQIESLKDIIKNREQ